MGITLAIIAFAVSLASLIACVHFFLRSVEHIGITIGVRPFVVGSLIIAFGTTSPELMISIFAVLNGSPGVPIAQAVGSNIANILFVLGIASLFIRRVSATMTKQVSKIDLPFIVGSTFLYILSVWDGVVFFYEGLLLLTAFGVYVGHIFFSRDNRSYPTTTQKQLGDIVRVPRSVGMFFLTIVGIALASHLVVESLQSIAHAFSVPEGVIAVTVLAIGTSLPEIVVAVQAALRNEIELVYGSIVGANIFNLLVVVGIPALITTLYVDFAGFSLLIFVLAGALLLFVISSLSTKVRSWEGIIFILLYVLLVIQLGGILT
ncbi:MAG: calcium/sodium antiporter [Candidatus Kaiserbacteria bacterium]|nr:calcium/sodium antiporter [Candidatus Kaiserbacteria bacterium]